MSSSAANPFQPPRSQVEDIRGGSGSHQPVQFWSSKGRVSRLQYVGYLMGGYLLLILASAIFGGIAAAGGLSPEVGGVIGAIAAIPYVVFSILMLIQRSHDMGWSGWTSLLALIPFAAFVWIFKAGTPGDNRFGAQPPPNTTKVKVLALLLPIVGIIGIVAAIALPAYQGYALRAKGAQAPAPIQQPAP
ncbi:MAG: DUF805 domain-containing protein [Rubrivivax sp.]|nr:MAG: DUF805 domain-containing protein [Rubrivivax sp.]